jgi:hypothetical protein
MRLRISSVNPYKLGESVSKSVHPGSGSVLYPQSISKALQQLFEVTTVSEAAEIDVKALEIRKGAQSTVNAFVFVHGPDIADLRERPMITCHSHQRVYSALVRDFKCGEI